MLQIPTSPSVRQALQNISPTSLPTSARTRLRHSHEVFHPDDVPDYSSVNAQHHLPCSDTVNIHAHPASVDHIAAADWDGADSLTRHAMVAALIMQPLHRTLSSDNSSSSSSSGGDCTDSSGCSSSGGCSSNDDSQPQVEESTMRRCLGTTPPRPHQRRQQRLVAALSSAATSSPTHDHLSPMTVQQRQQQQRAMEPSDCEEARKQSQLQQERNNAQYRLDQVAMRCRREREWELSEVQRLFEESVQRVVVEQGKICVEEQLQKQLGAGAAGPEDPKGPNQPSKWQAWWQALLCPSGGGGCGGSHAAACP
ncbi:MAG: hypothetical protein WDW36_008583 [Sanguina aurantia]